MLDLINKKVPVYKSCDMREVVIIFGVMFVLSFILLAILFEIIFNSVLPVLILTLFLAVPLTTLALNISNYLKEGKPIGYSTIRISLWLSDIGLKQNPYVTKEQTWSIGRYE